MLPSQKCIGAGAQLHDGLAHSYQVSHVNWNRDSIPCRVWDEIQGSQKLFGFGQADT